MLLLACCLCSYATLFKACSISSSMTSSNNISSIIVIVISRAMSASIFSSVSLQFGRSSWTGSTSHRQVLLILLLFLLLLLVILLLLLLLLLLLMRSLMHACPPGGTRAPIIKWLEDTGLVQQLLSFISFSSISCTGSDKSSTCRLVDSADSTPLPPVSLLELAHAQPLQVTRHFMSQPIITTTNTFRHRHHHRHHHVFTFCMLQALGNATALLTRVLRLLPAGPTPAPLVTPHCFAVVVTSGQHHVRGSTRWIRQLPLHWSGLSGA
jgi:hypothetical protein